MNSESLSIIIGKRIREHRIKNGYSQEGFAHKVGVHRTYIGIIERGEKNITVLTAYRISQCFNITLSELFQDI